MKKHILIFLVFTFLVCISLSTKAQTNTFPSSGNVGIGTGTITPTNKLEINGAANQLKLTAATAGQEASMLLSPGGTLNAWQTGVSSAVAGNGWWVYENTANAYRMVIQQGGKVGIGTTNPSYKLCISNAGASGVEIDAVGGANGGGFIQGYNRATSAYIPMSSYALSHHFFIGNFEKMTIQASTGNVGIGTTNPLSYSKLDVRGGALNVVNYTTNGYGYIGRNADPGNNDSYLYHVISTNYHIIGSSKNGTGAIKKLGFALGSTDTESDIKMTIDNTGNVGIGTTTPYSKFQVGTGIAKVSTGDCYSVALGYGAAYIGFNASRQASNSWISETDGSTQNGGFIMFSRLEGDLNFAPINSTGNSNQSYNDASVYSRVALKIDRNGNVGVGTKNNTMSDGITYKLAVNGKIVCEQVKVINDVPSSDFVFNEDYELMDIMQTEKYIKEHKHLPEIPSAEEFKKNGYTVGQMDDLLLRKIEQLTLYVIELKKENNNLKNENSEIKSKMSDIENTK